MARFQPSPSSYGDALSVGGVDPFPLPVGNKELVLLSHAGDEGVVAPTRRILDVPLYKEPWFVPVAVVAVVIGVVRASGW